MNKKLILGFLVLFGSHQAMTQISLEQCIDAAEKNMPQAQLLPMVQQAEALQINALNKNLMPQASLGGQATWQSAVTGLNLKIPGVEVKTIPKDQYKATVDFNQTIWDGGQLKSQKSLTMAGSQVEIKSIESSIYQIKEQVSNLYFGAILAELQLKSLEITENDLQGNLKRVRANQANGTAMKSNVLALEAKLIEINQLRFEILGRRGAALKSLAILTGLEVNENTKLDAPNYAQTIENYTINRPELKQFEAQKTLTLAKKAVIDAKYMPKINLFGTGGYGRPGLNFLSPDFSPYFLGGISFKMPISQIYTRAKNTDYQLIDLNKEKIEKQKDQFIQQINIKLAGQLAEVSKLEKQILEDKKLIEIKAELKKIAQNRLDNGIITTSEFLTELDNETLANQNMILHEVQLLQAKNAIKITLGN